MEVQKTCTPSVYFLSQKDKHSLKSEELEIERKYYT